MIRLFKVGMAIARGTQSQTANPYAGADTLVREVLLSGYIGQGPKVEEFESLLPHLGFEGRPLTTNSCTSALDLALELIGVGPGDKVLTTPQTCTATNSPIVKRGAIPIWCDVDTQGLISPTAVRHRYQDHPEAKAIMAVDWAGTLANYKALRKAAPGVPIIQDAAHRFGGPTGGDYVAYSFQAIKFLTTGDGGALLTPPNQYERAKLLRWYGLDRESSADFRCAQDIQEVGFKYHMNDIAAAIGLANGRLAVQHLATHRENAAYLAHKLGTEFREDSHYWFFPLTVSNRDTFIQFMKERGIEASQVHARNDKHRGFRFPSNPLPGVDWFDAHQVAIPCGWWLSKDDLDHIAEAVLDWASS